MNDPFQIADRIAKHAKKLDRIQQAFELALRTPDAPESAAAFEDMRVWTDEGSALNREMGDWIGAQSPERAEHTGRNA